MDSCQSIGTLYRGGRHATVGDIGAFSFVRNKSMTCGGEGGMVVTDDDELAYRAQLSRTTGAAGTTRSPTTRSSSATTTG